MAKPRIIIADADIDYIIPLQQKFIEDLFEKVNLEIITDKNFFDSFFSVPQKAEILIISDKLYNSAIQKHSIENIFLMTEQPLEDGTNQQDIFALYKYTSIKNIFQSIVGKSTCFRNIANNSKNKTEIILFLSASGGVGKTTASIALSACMNKNYKKVLYINANHLQSFQALFMDMSPISDSAVYSKLINLNENIFNDIRHVIRNEVFDYLPPFKASLMSLGIDYSVYESIALSAKKEKKYDYIVIDSDTVFDEYKARLIDIADKVVIITAQNRLSVYSTNNLVSNINGINTEKYIFICNNFNDKEPNALIAADIEKKFSVREYIGHFHNCDQLKIIDFAEIEDIQRTAFLIE